MQALSSDQITEDQLANLVAILDQNQPVAVLTGAGISVASGLPVYRDTEGNWVHSKPVEGPVFRAQESVRQRYWCRSFIGWPSFAKASPNAVHRDIAALQKTGVLSTLITQNVDGLHLAAGSSNVTDLHGNLSEVICLNCSAITQRSELQLRLHALNPRFMQLDFEIAPDGDAIIEDRHITDFKTASCEKCHGVLKPHVVFFGDNVPRGRVQKCMKAVLQSRLLLCIGTSLMVYSGFRFCRAAHDANIPIVIINNGRTRADDIATAGFGGDCTQVLAALRRSYCP